MKNLRNLLIFNGIMTSAVVGLLFTGFHNTEEAKGGGRQSPEQTIRTISLNKDFDFCGEKFPMDNWDVKQRLDGELLRNVYLHSGTILALKRANALFPMIEPILKEEGAPDDLKYLAVAESVLSNAISPAGAKGVWQFMKGTALQFGLEVNEEVDERYNLEKATRAACKYMKSERDRLGSWVLAAAAYNGGPGRIGGDKATQRANNFFEMNLAADETMRYPFRIVAIKEVMKNPELYEYEIDKEHLYDMPKPSRFVEVSGPVANWGDFALEQGTNYRMLKLYNPWLVDSKLTNKARKTYRIAIP
jgi:membrane-bound lytic murein transglycosylase D